MKGRGKEMCSGCYEEFPCSALTEVMDDYGEVELLCEDCLADREEDE